MSNKKLPEKYNSEIAQLNEEIELLKKEILKRKKKIIKIRKNKNLDKTAIKWYNIFRKCTKEKLDEILFSTYGRDYRICV